MKKETNKKVVIIGAGLAGLSLATELVDEGFNVLVLEKNKYLGGRASNVKDTKMHDAVPIGPHVFVSAFNNCRRFFHKIKAGHAIYWDKQVFLEIVHKGIHHVIKANKLPRRLYMVPWLMNYRFMTLGDKLSNTRMVFHIMFSGEKKLEKLDGIDAYDYLSRKGVSKGAVQNFWRFFVLSLLNVPLELCSAAEFTLLLKHWSKLKNHEFGLARVGLGDVYADNSEKYIEKRKGKVVRNSVVEEIVLDNNKIKHLKVKTGGTTKLITGDIFVSTLDPISLRTILPKRQLASNFFRNLNAFKGLPYITVNLWFDKKITDKKFWALLNTEDNPKYINTDFYDKSNIYAKKRNYSFITSNIIYSKAYEYLTDKEIVLKTIEELKEAIPNYNAKLKHYHVHRIPYVIYIPYPGMRKHKLSQKTPISNFYLAGDWTIREITQCMEAAVRSGYKCAERILADHGIKKEICDDALI